jgi:hypothetical protein
MKPIALIAALLLLPGCSAMEGSDYALYYQAVRQSFAAGFGGPARITRAQAAAIPYASIGYRVNDEQEQLLVLATNTGDEQLWTSGAHVVVVTRGGRIVRTVGLAHDVSAVTPEQSVALTGVTAQARSVRLEDFPDLGAYGVVVNCVASSQGPQTIVILGRGIPTRKVEESCHSQFLDWSFIDSYWVDPASGLVWRSIQHISPKTEKIELEVLRPPA